MRQLCAWVVTVFALTGGARAQTGGGHTVIESFPVGTPHEMVTVYHLDGESIVLTNYGSQNTQPRMRSRGLEGRVLAFEFEGGARTN